MSFLLIRTLEKPPKREQSESSPILPEVAEGLRFIARDDLMRTLIISLGRRNFFGSFFATLYGIYAIRELGLTPASLGLLIGCGGIGALCCSGISGRYGWPSHHCER